MTDVLAPRSAPVLRSLARPGTLVVLDFDGTIAPITRNHEEAGLTDRTRSILRRLALRYPVAILTGRGVADVRGRLEGIPVRWVVGSHGVEWPGEAPGHAAWRRRVGEWEATLRRALDDVDGIEIEAKPLAVAIHYRKCPSPEEGRRRAMEAARRLPGAHLVAGTMVVNLLPEGAGDKGDALVRLAAESGAERVLFVGDDVTDEAAFGVRLDVPAVMVRVGRSASSLARYVVARRASVDTLLARLVELREGSSGHAVTSTGARLRGRTTGRRRTSRTGRPVRARSRSRA